MERSSEGRVSEKGATIARKERTKHGIHPIRRKRGAKPVGKWSKHASWEKARLRYIWTVQHARSSTRSRKTYPTGRVNGHCRRRAGRVDGERWAATSEEVADAPAHKGPQGAGGRKGIRVVIGDVAIVTMSAHAQIAADVLAPGARARLVVTAGRLESLVHHLENEPLLRAHRLGLEA